MDGSRKRPDWSELQRIAFLQSGYFRTTQAAAAGFSNQLLRKHLLAGRFTRHLRGVYRFVDVPPGEHDDLVELWLWSSGAGVFSHETALALHGLSDALPSRVHMTVPRKWSARSAVPRILVLHFGRLPTGDRTWLGALPVTTVARTIRDAVDAGVDPDLVAQAISEGTARKMIDRSDLRGIVAPRRGGSRKPHRAGVAP